MSPTLNLRLRPDWAEIETLPERIEAFLASQPLPDDVVTAVAMVTCELSENAAKYGSFRDAQATIDVAVTIDSANVTVEVTNPVAPGESDTLSRLDGMIQWIRGFQDPFEAYLERLKEVSSQTLDSHESGLGLVRIAYEGRAVLDFFIDERNVLAVSAVHPV